MRLRVRIDIFDHSPRLAHELLDPLGLPVDETSGFQVVEVFDGSEEHKYLAREIARRGIGCVELKTMHFEQKELDEAEYLRMGPAGYCGSPAPMDVYPNDYEKVSYNISTRCPICHNGAIQDRPFQMKERLRFGRSDILALLHAYEFVVTSRLKGLIEEAHLTGVDFWPVLDYKKKVPIQGFHQLHVNSILPPMSPRTEFELVHLPDMKTPCSCGKTGWNLREHQMIYSRKDIEHAKDFNKTHEWLGGAYVTGQRKVVSERVYRLFKEHKIKTVTFEPVIIE